MTTVYVFALQVPMVKTSCSHTLYPKNVCSTQVCELMQQQLEDSTNAQKHRSWSDLKKTCQTCDQDTELCMLWSSEKYSAAYTLHIAFIAALTRMTRTQAANCGHNQSKANCDYSETVG